MVPTEENRKSQQKLTSRETPLPCTTGFYRCKEKNALLYRQINECLRKVFSDEYLDQCRHEFDTQKNEAMNTSVSKYARKGRTYGTSMSLESRVMISLGIQNYGYERFWKTVYDGLSITMSPALRQYLEKKDGKKKLKNEYESKFEVKVRRSQKTNDKIKAEIIKAKKDAERGCTYGSGVALKRNATIPLEIMEIEAKKKKNKSQNCPFVGCLGKQHTTTKSKNCKYYGCKDQKQLDEAIETYLWDEYPDIYDGEIEV